MNTPKENSLSPNPEEILVPEVSRRTVLATAGALASAALTRPTNAHDDAHESKLRFCLNTSTIRGQKLPLTEEIDLIGQAGYDGIEPWIREIEEAKSSGVPLPDLRKRIADQGLRVESAIGFAQWVVDDESARKKGLEQMKRDMELVRDIGGTRIAAPPVGMHGGESSQLDLFAAAERYHTLLELGREMGVTPQAEIWGPSKNMSRLGEAVFVAIESGHPDACVLPDVYHIYRGGSRFDGLGLLSSAAIHCFHFNDYPDVPSREQLNDGDRIYPGDGAAPWAQIVSLLKSIGFAGAVSLELFNRSYWEQDAMTVAKTGLKKMKAIFGMT